MAGQNTVDLPDMTAVRRIIAAALAEDTGPGGAQADMTSVLLIPETQQGRMQLNARQDMTACGLFLAAMVYAQLDARVAVETHCAEGAAVSTGTALVTATGPARALLTGERVALNLIQRACGIATLTRRYRDAAAGTKAVILDTRKTMPGLRALDKYAVRAAGAQNHRMGLHDMVMIKDNHIALAGSLTQAVARARAGTALPIEVECDTLAQVEEAVAARPDRILLDNMDTAMLSRAVALVCGRVKLEASGGVNLSTVRAIAETGVDYISVGALTHSAPAADIGADIAIR